MNENDFSPGDEVVYYSKSDASPIKAIVAKAYVRGEFSINKIDESGKEVTDHQNSVGCMLNLQDDSGQIVFAPHGPGKRGHFGPVEPASTNNTN